MINEYLDIAHGFFGGEEPRFANGVLDAHGPRPCGRRSSPAPPTAPEHMTVAGRA